MTLSRFLKENIYIPLGGNKKVNFKLYFYYNYNASRRILARSIMEFILWGFFHSILIIINHIFINLFKKSNISNIFLDTFKIIITFVLVSFGWVIFKLQSILSIKIFFKGIFGLNGFKLNPNLERLVDKFSIFESINFQYSNIYYYGISQLIFIFLVY